MRITVASNDPGVLAKLSEERGEGRAHKVTLLAGSEQELIEELARFVEIAGHKNILILDLESFPTLLPTLRSCPELKSMIMFGCAGGANLAELKVEAFNFQVAGFISKAQLLSDFRELEDFFLSFERLIEFPH